MEHPYQWAVTKLGGNKAFIFILRLWIFMYCEILDKACNFLLTRLQIFATWVSKPSLLFKLIPNSFLLLFLMTLLSILIEKGSSALKMRWHLSAFAFKKLFENHSKSTFPTFSSFFCFPQSSSSEPELVMRKFSKRTWVSVSCEYFSESITK